MTGDSMVSTRYRLSLGAMLAAVGMLAVLVSPLAFGQAGQPARRIISGPNLPATCLSSVLIKDLWYKTGSSSGVYICTAANTWTPVTSSSAPIVGPGSSTDNAAVRFDGTGGSTLQNSVVLIGDTGNVTGLGTLNTHTLPGGTDTIALLAATQTFTGKSISGATNTLSAIGNASLTNSSVTIGSTSVSLGATAATVAGLTLTQPTIADYTNAAHDHLDADDAGTLSTSAITSGTFTLAGARFANQGTTTTVLHGNAAGNPSFGSVVDADLSLTAPALGAPTATTIQTSGNVGIGVAPSGTAGLQVLAQNDGNVATIIRSFNNGTGVSSQAAVQARSDAADFSLRAYSASNTATFLGFTLGGWSVLNNSSLGNGILFGTTNAAPIHVGTNNTTRLSVASGGDITLPSLAITAGTMTAVSEYALTSGQTCRSWSNANVVALGAATAGDIAFGTLPANYLVRNAYIKITGAAAGPTTVTVSLGRTSATYIDYIVASDAKAAANTVYGDASAERGTNLTGYDLPSVTGTTVLNAHFVSTGGDLNTVTGSTGTVCVFTEKVMW